MILEIKRKHFLKSEGYISNTHCPLALATKEYFKTENISVGGFTFTNYDTNTTYSFNEDLWNESIVEPKIKEAEKCFKNKKKFNSVFLEIKYEWEN